MMNLDELPVGQGQKFEVSELPPETSTASSTSTLPLKERLKSKNPKVRFEATADLLKEISEASSFTEYYPSVQKLLSDSHPGAQEKALDCLMILLDKKPPNISDDDLISILIEKCITSAKAGTKTKAVDCFLILAELPNAQSVIYDALKSYLTTKGTAAKTLAAVLHCLNQLLSNFGNAVFPAKEVLKHVAVQAGSTNSAIKNEAMAYLKEAYRWIKDKILPSIESLKPVQQEELKKAFEECVDKAIPKRAIRGQTIKVEEDGKEATAENSKEEEKQEFLMAEETSVLGKFGEKWCNTLMGLKKWTEKRDKLEELLRATNVKRIKAENFTELGATLKKVLNDSNVVVVNTAIKIIGQLAKGLRESFASYARHIFNVILQKCKDKKTLAASQKCLEDLVMALKLGDMLEDIKAALNDKSPLIKSKICFWLETVGFPNADEGLLGTWAKVFGPTLGKLTDDAVGEVRDSALSCLGVLKGLVNDAALESMVKDMNIQKQQKIMKSAEGIRRTNTSSPQKEAGESEKEEKREERKEKPGKSKPEVIVIGADTMAKKRKPMPKLPSMKAKETKQETVSKPKEVKLEDVGPLPTQEEADKIVLEKIPEEIAADFDSLPWKEKQERLKELSIWLKDNPQSGDFLECFSVWLRLRLKGFKESNLNVVKEALALLQALADAAVLSKKFASVIVPGLAEKLGDQKHSEVCKDIAMGIADSATPTYVATLLIYTTQSTKNVNAIKVLLSLLVRMVEEYTAKMVPLVNLLEYAKGLLTHTNSQVKIAATRVIMAIYAQLGDDIKPVIASNLKEAVYKSLDPEFAKTKPKEAELKRKLKGAAEAEMESKKKVKSALDGLIQRVNISPQITSKLLSDLNSTKMKAREEAKKALEKILASANNCIQPTGLSPLINALKARMNEPAKNLAKGFITLVGNLATALGPGCRQYTKIILQPLMWNLADKQTGIKTETVIAMDKFAAAAGIDVVFSGLGPLLEKDNPDLRAEVLNWILKNKKELEKVNADYFVKPLVEALQDRSKEIRVLVEEVVGIIMPRTGYQAFMEAIKDLKPIVKETLVNILSKYKPKDTDDKPIVIIEPAPEISVGTPERKAHKRAVSPLPNVKPHLVPPRDMKSGRKSVSKSGQKSALSKSFCANVPADEKALYATVNPKLLNTGELIAEPVIINPIGNKEKRAEADRNTRWPVTAVRADYVSKLKSTLKSAVNSTVFACMFSADTKKNVEALKLLADGARLDVAAILDVIDLLFKWCTMKLVEQGNVTINKSVADFVALVFEEATQSNYVFQEFESAAILPILCERLGISNASLRNSFKALVKKAYDVCPTATVYSHLVSAVDSKNNKTRVEALAMLKELVSSYGDKVVTAKDLKYVVKMLEDNLVKNEVGDFLAEVYRHKGEKIWTILGTIPDKSKTLLKEKFVQVTPIEKPKGSESEIKYKSPENNDSEIIDEKSKPIDRAKDESEEMSLEFFEILASNVLTKKLTEQKNEEQNEEQKETQPKQPLNTIDQCLEALRDKDILRKKDALIALYSIIKDLYKNNKEELANHSNAIFTEFSNLLKELFEKPLQELHLKFGKFFMALFTEVCAVKLMASKLTDDTLFATMEQLLLNYLHDGLSNMGESGEGEAMCKSFNSAVSKLLCNSDATSVFTVLLKVLRKYKDSPDSDSKSLQKLPSLAINCLKRLIRTFEALLPAVRTSDVLLAMHECLLDSSGIFSLNPDGAGVKIIKNLLIELVRFRKEAIWEDYNASVKTHTSGDIYLSRWIGATLKSLFPKGKERLNEQLKEIFLGFRSKETIEDSIEKLSALIKANPGFSVDEYLASCSSRLRQFIVDGLKRHGVDVSLENEEEKEKESKDEVQLEGDQVERSLSASDVMAKINKYKEQVYGNTNKPQSDNS